jgi:hypothetical protein
MIPLYAKTLDRVEPRDSIYYLLAANGVFLVKKTVLFESVTPPVEVAGVEPQSIALKLSFPQVPHEVMATIYGFFQFVFRKWDGEAIVFLFYSPVRNEFRVDAPPQRLTRHRTPRGWRTEGRVEYGAVSRPTGFLKLGDVHSHGDSPPFFSTVDDRDDGEDGLRIVMGNLDRPEPAVRASFIASGIRFKVPTTDVIEEFSAPAPPPEAWIRRVRCTYKDSLFRKRSDGNGQKR